MEQAIISNHLKKQNFLNNTLFTLLLLTFITVVAITVNSSLIAFLFILAPATIINVIWILIHTNSVFNQSKCKFWCLIFKIDNYTTV